MKQKPRIVPELVKLDGRGGTPSSTRTRRQAGARRPARRRRLEQARRGARNLRTRRRRLE